MSGPARRPLRRLRTPVLATATLAAALCVMPSGAFAANAFSTTFSAACTFTPTTGSPTAFPVSLRISGSTDGPITEGTKPNVAASLDITPQGAGPATLKALGPYLALNGSTSITGGTFGTISGGVRSLIPVALSTGRSAPTAVASDSASFPASSSPSGINNGRAAAIGSEITLTWNPFTEYVEVRNTPDAPRTTAGTLFCAPAPGGPTKIAALPVEPRTPQGAPTIRVVSDRWIPNTGGAFIASGTFDGPILSATVGGVPAQVEKLTWDTARITAPSGLPAKGVPVVINNAAGSASATVDYVAANEPNVLSGRFVDQCTRTGDPSSVGHTFQIVSKVRVKVPSFAPTGSTVLLAVQSEQLMDADNVQQFAAPFARLSFTMNARAAQTIGVTGTDTSSVDVDGGFQTLTESTTGLPLSFAPSIVLAVVPSAGVVTAPPGGAVTLRHSGATVAHALQGADLLDGLPTSGGETITCTPVGNTTLGTIPTSDPRTTPGPTTPGPTTPIPTTPGPTGTAIDYAASGIATLRTLVKGTLPLKGTLASTFGADGSFSGDLKLGETTGNLIALGFLPVTAKMNFVPTAPVTGALSGGVLNATAKVRIKLAAIATLGIPIAALPSATCQAKQVSNIPLKSTGTFSPQAGGTLAGVFSISNLSGCGPLTGLVSSLTAGGGNAIALALKPAPVVVS